MTPDPQQILHVLYTARGARMTVDVVTAAGPKIICANGMRRER